MMKDDYIFFTHPNYFEAGRYLFEDSSDLGQKRFLVRVRKALFSLNPDTSFLVANQFSFLAKELSNNYYSELFDIAFEGMNSIYPSVEDLATVFLIEFMEKLTNELKANLVSRIESGGAPSSHIFWHENIIPFINKDGGTGMEEYFFKMDKERILNIENSFQKHNIVSSYNAWEYLLAIRNIPGKKISSQILEIFLQYKEVFLRRRAAFLFILRECTAINISDLNKIFSDAHPSVVFDAIRGCFMAWRSFPKIVKDQVTSVLKDLFTKKPIAIRANYLMTTFAKEHNLDSIDWSNMSADEKKELWNLWGTLFPIFIQQLPSGVYLNPGRFGMTMQESLKYLRYDLGLKVLEAWYERIDYRIKNKGVPDEYEMAVADDLMILTKKDHKSRAILFDKLVSYPDTNFLISNLKWMMQYWSDLDQSEKNKILSLITSNREDVGWIKAVLLNSHSTPPTEIQHGILGNSNFFELETKNVVLSFSEDLLVDCLHVYFGYPQPLWWLAVHHHNKNFWGKIIRYILYKKKDPFYSLCLRELLSDGVNGFSGWPDGLKIWGTLCRRPGRKIEQAKRLIFETATTTCSIKSTKRLWKYLIMSFRREGKEDELISLIVDHIEILQITKDGKEDLIGNLGKEFMFKKIYPKIEPDHSVITLLEQVINTPKLEVSIIPIIKTIVAYKRSFRFYYTSLLIKHMINKYSFSEDLKNLLSSFYNDYEDVGKEKMLSLKHELNEDISITNWVNL